VQILILILVFAGTVLLLVGTFAFVNRRRLSESDAALSRLRVVGDRPGAAASSILRDERVSDMPFLNRLLSGQSFTATLGVELARAGSKRKPGEFVLISAVAAIVAFAVGQSFVGAPLALLLGFAGAMLPYFSMKRQQAARTKKFEDQLPDALEMLVNALKAGYSLQAAMEFVGQEMPAPLGPEFGRFYDEQRLGVEVRTALLSMQERVGTADFNMFVTSLLIQRETGGNLGEVLGNLGALMRERVAFRGTVATLTAEPKMSARILGVLPLLLFMLIATMNPDFIQPLIQTDLGHKLLAYAIVSVAVGYAVMMRIAKVDM
jgi:tight adherence protein B